MAKAKSYRVVAEIGVVGFKGVIHKKGDVIQSDQVPDANLKAWLHFKQVELVEDQAPEVSGQTSEVSEPKKKGGKS